MTPAAAVLIIVDLAPSDQPGSDIKVD